MDNKNQFEKLHSEILSEIRKNGACGPGYKSVLSSESIKGIADSIKKWWNEVLGMHLESTLHLFDEFFSRFESEFNANGIYYNQDASEGYVIIYNAKVKLSGTAKGRSFGLSEVEMRGNASLVAFDESKVHAHDYSNVELRERSSGEMFDQSELKAYDDSLVVCRGGKSLIVSNRAEAETYMCGSIHAYSAARIKNMNPRIVRRIHLHEDSAIV